MHSSCNMSEKERYKQSSEWPSLSTGGLAGSSAVTLTHKRKLTIHSFDKKPETIKTVEHGTKPKIQIAKEFDIPLST